MKWLARWTSAWIGSHHGSLIASSRQHDPSAVARKARAASAVVMLAACFHGSTQVAADDAADLAKQLTFHVSFDQSIDARVAEGDPRGYTGEDLSRAKFQAGLPPVVEHRAQEGKWGGSLQFKDVSPQVLFYRGKGNVPYSTDGFDLTVSFWMKLDPEKELKPGYVDPMQITDDAWNNSCLFVDFTKDEVPRHFRLGVFSDYTYWNPKDTPWESIADADRPMIVVTRHPFKANEWTHVAYTLQGVNSESGCTSKFYLNGQLQGIREAKEKFTWDQDKLAIMLGIQYIGGMDDFAVFRTALTAEQIEQLMKLPGGVTSLGKSAGK